MIISNLVLFLSCFQDVRDSGWTVEEEVEGSGEVEAQEAGLAETVGSVAEVGGRVMAGTREEVRTGVAASGVAEAAVIKVWYLIVKCSLSQ